MRRKSQAARLISGGRAEGNRVSYLLDITKITTVIGSHVELRGAAMASEMLHCKPCHGFNR